MLLITALDPVLPILVLGTNLGLEVHKVVLLAEISLLAWQTGSLSCLYAMLR